MWLVDTDARGVWQAEAGTFYEVVSHKDQYARGSWQSQEVKERRTRWEPRIGRLERRYENVAAPALEQHTLLERRIGGYRLDQAAAYQPDQTAGALIRLPDRSPNDAWRDAQAGVQTAASDECRRAAKADDIREFRWTWQYKDRNWTQLLTPAYSAVYHDDEGAARVVLVNGQNGQVWGEKRASMQRARQVALLVGGAAALFFVLSLIAFIVAAVYAPGSAALGVVGLFVAVGAAIGAIAPLMRVSRFNAAQAREDTRPA